MLAHTLPTCKIAKQINWNIDTNTDANIDTNTDALLQAFTIERAASKIAIQIHIFIYRNNCNYTNTDTNTHIQWPHARLPD